MNGLALKGLVWGHRRATGPMDALAREAAGELGIDLVWTVRPLSGFESDLSADTLAPFDLVIWDHPFCGLVARERLFLPLGELVPGLEDAAFVGASLASYRMNAHVWALPVDAATQTAIYRPDLLAEPPADWDGVLALGAREARAGRALGLAAKSPHGFLVLAAIAANLGAPLGAAGREAPFDPAVLDEAAGRLAALWPLCDPRGTDWNAIDLHERMARGDALAYAPLAYAYFTYAEDDMAHPLRFAPFAGAGPVAHAGTVLGGAGLGIVASSRHLEEAVAVLSLVADGAGQRALVVPHHGQPAHRAAWEDPAADARTGGAFSATRATIEAASMRPRFPGYIPFQDAAGHATAAFLAGEITRPALAEALAAAWRARQPG